MNINQIKERLVGKLTDPTKIEPKYFSEELLMKKCKQWESVTVMRGLNPTSIETMMQFSIDEVIHAIIDTKVMALKKESRWLSIEDQIFKGIVSSLQSSIWDTIDSNVMSEIDDLVRGSINDSRHDSVFIHTYAKFTSAEFESFMIKSPRVARSKEEIIEIHSKFKDLDWFWENGLCCFRGVIKNEYYVCSYNNPKCFSRIMLPEIKKDIVLND